MSWKRMFTCLCRCDPELKWLFTIFQTKAWIVYWEDLDWKKNLSMQILNSNGKGFYIAMLDWITGWMALRIYASIVHTIQMFLPRKMGVYKPRAHPRRSLCGAARCFRVKWPSQACTTYNTSVQSESEKRNWCFPTMDLEPKTIKLLYLIM